MDTTGSQFVTQEGQVEWMNEPPSWRSEDEGRVLRLRAGGHTDFWRKTWDGGLRDNGHFYYRQVTGDFTVSARVTGQYASLYDQAGLMVREDERTWLKCGVELLHGVQQASTVVTHDWSDWSVQPLQNPPSFRLKVVRRGGTVEVYFAPEGGEFTMMRQAYLSEAPALLVGVMAAAPTGDGFDVLIEDLVIEQAQASNG